ncbi:MAG: sigma 54-interacting transcriptional regulator [Deltaproteobacteria bacterium]|nr:sigma 54-interacting transcriptional regulator [Deltaproteobacteria bacterium]
MASPTFSAIPPTQVHSDLSSVGHDLGFTERRSQLVVMSGPEAGRVVDVVKSPFVVGKGEECDLVLTEPTVSRTHFNIESDQGAFVIRDLGSTNGTWIDQFRIKEAWLRPGTVLRAGQAQLRFEPVFKPLDLAPAATERFGSLVGRSVRMRQIFTLLERVAKTEATVVIFGETGTGKSAVAQAIHESSLRKSGPFITVDCGAIAENLIESELFGHEKGAFTGADRLRQGALERAQGGTLFIDELVDLRLDLQPRLLRVLEEREVRRVGGNAAIKLDVRIIAASRFDLWREVQEKRFREDLYFRLAVFTLPLPSLRERKEDIPLLATAFARAHKLVPGGGDRLLSRFGPAAFDKLMNHPFPGNVRELRNVIERSITLDSDPNEMLTSSLFPSLSPSMPNLTPTLTPGALPPTAPLPLPPRTPTQPLTPPAVIRPGFAMPAGGDDSRVALEADCTLPFKEAKEQLLERFEAAYFKRLVAHSDGNASAMARAAGIDRKHLYTLAKKHHLDLKGRPEG